VNDAGEGNVVYLTNSEQTLSIFKLKTVEYRIFRKIREKLRNYVGS